MENYGLIIRRLRQLENLTLQATAKKIGKSAGWLSEVENQTGMSRLTEREFNRIVDILNGTKHRAMFRTWVATHKRHENIDQMFDGAVFKFIRTKKKLALKDASKLVGLSPGQLCKIETGVKPVSYELRNKIMKSYGYNPSSFKNLNSDPVRSKVIPSTYKLEILLQCLQESQVEAILQFALNIHQSNPKESNSSL